MNIKQLLMLLMCVCCLSANAQTITTTGGSTSSVTGNAGISFAVRNNNTGAIVLNDLSMFRNTASNGATYTLWYSSTSLSGASGSVSPTTWTQIATATPANMTSNGVGAIFTGLTFSIPASTTYRFCVVSSNRIDVSSSGTSSYNTNGIDVLTGSFALSGNPVGYSGSGTPVNLSTSGRFFAGSLTFSAATACVNPPTGGTATASVSSMCGYTPVAVRLNLTGHSFGSAQTYQWQRATTATGTYTNIGSSQTVPEHNLSAPSATFFYRAAVTCGGNTGYSTPVQVTVTPGLPAGSYTINSASPTGGTNFNSYNAAVAAMSCGIAGPVVFDVVTGSGPYVEQVIIPEILNSSATNTITFNGNGTILRFPTATSAQRAVVKLDGADNVTFNNVTVDAINGSFAYAFHLINNADNNTITNSTINANATSTADEFCGIVISGSNTSPTTTGSNSDNITISNNTINGGYYSIAMFGSSSKTANNKIVNNVITNFYSTGIYAEGNTGLLVSGNDISRTTRTNMITTYGIRLDEVINSDILANRVHSLAGGSTTTTSTMYGIHLSASDSRAGGENIFANNAIYNLTRGGTLYGIYNSSSDSAFYYHNTVSMEDAAYTGTSDAYGFYQTTSARGIRFQNNIIKITRGGTGDKYAMYMNTAATTFESERNAFFLAAGNPSFVTAIGYSNGKPRVTLVDWQAATTKDSFSVNYDPAFVSAATGALSPTNPSVNDIGTPVGITTDITGAARSTTTPDAGAFEFVATACVAPPTPGTTVVSSIAVCGGSQLTLDLQGNSFGDGQTYQWQSSATATGTFTDIGASSTKTKLVINPTETRFYRASVTCGTSTVFSNPVRVFANTTMTAGTYTINRAVPTGGTNFESFTDAVNALKCGISGSVTFQVSPGTYNEQIDIPTIPGASQSNKVTFVSTSANPADVVMTFNGTGVLNNHIVRLTNAHFITFKRMKFTNGSTAFGRVIDIVDSSSNDSIVNCHIEGALVTSNSDVAACIYANEVKGTNNVINSNRISKGSYGIRLRGPSQTVLAGKWVMDGNEIVDAFFYSAYLYHTSDMKFRKNSIQTNSTSATHYGVYAFYCDDALEVIGNRIQATIAGTSYGIDMENSDGTATTRGIVANNVIIAGLGSNPAYGLRAENNKYKRIYNNSVRVNSSTDAGAAGFFTYVAADVENEVRNNIFYNEGLGGALYISNTTATATNSSDYNNLYSADSVLTRTNTPAVTYKSLSAWRVGTGQDQNSISYNPGFTNMTDLTPDPNNPASWSVNGRGVHIAGNDKDYNGATRVTALADGVPDLGAYEFTPTSTPPAADAIPAAPAKGITQHFLFGQDTVAVIDWSNRSLIPTNITVRQYTGTVAPQLTTVTGGNFTYFYTDIDVPATTYDFNARIYYKNPWMGTVSSEANMRMIKKFGTYPWIEYNGSESNTNVTRNFISASGLTSHGYFTGVDNGNVFSAYIKPQGKVIFCPGGSVALQAVPNGLGFTYQWKLDGTAIPNAINPTHLAQAAGNYEVEVMNGTDVAFTMPIEIYEIPSPSTVVSASGSTRFCAGGSVKLDVQTSTGAKYQWRKNGTDIAAANTPTYTATDAGVYTVQVVSEGCAATSGATNVSIGAPIVNLGRDTSFCQQAAVVLNAGNPGARYVWSTGDTTQTVSIASSTSGTYSVRVIAAPGCETGDTISFTVDPLPTVVGISYIRGGNSYQLSPSGVQNANRYLWIFGDGKTDTSRTITYNYTYRPNSVKLVVFNGCGSDTAEADLALSVNDAAGIKNIQLNVYPNPAQSVMTVAMEGDAQMKDITVLNNLGQVVYRTSVEATAKEQRIDVGNLPNGHYILRVNTTDSKVISKQFDVLR